MAKGNNKTTNKDRIEEAWKRSGEKWPPVLRQKVRLFVPSILRGRVAWVIATEDAKTKESKRKATKGKVRVALKASGETYQFTVSKLDVFPHSLTLKELLAIWVW